MSTRPTCSLLVLVILCANLFSCHKRGDTVAIPAIDSSKISNSNTAPAITYPHTDTFIGNYFDSEGLNGKDSPFVFLVIYPNPNQVVFMNDGPMNKGCVIFIKDTFAISPYTYYQAAIDTNRNISNQYYQISGDLFEFPTANTLRLSWSYHQYGESCDGIDHSCVFSGRKINK